MFNMRVDEPVNLFLLLSVSLSRRLAVRFYLIVLSCVPINELCSIHFGKQVNANLVEPQEI